MEWLQRVSPCKYRSKEDEFIGEIEKPVFKTDVISSVEKNYFMIIFVCGHMELSVIILTSWYHPSTLRGFLL